MAVRPEQIAIVQQSLPQVRERLVPASSIFYDNLFAVAPELRALFRGDMQSQGMRFMSTLATIADLLGDPEALGTELDELAAGHFRIGVRPEYFAPDGGRADGHARRDLGARPLHAKFAGGLACCL